jgi:hypothetical protein
MAFIGVEEMNLGRFFFSARTKSKQEYELILNLQQCITCVIDVGETNREYQLGHTNTLEIVKIDTNET